MTTTYTVRPSFGPVDEDGHQFKMWAVVDDTGNIVQLYYTEAEAEAGISTAVASDKAWEEFCAAIDNHQS